MEELERLKKGYTNSIPSGIGIVKILVLSPSKSQDVLEKCKEVLETILEKSSNNVWPSFEEWASMLPQWFVLKCAKETSDEEDQEWLKWWRKLSPEEQIRAEKEAGWSLRAWIGWFEPEERQWFWWNAYIENDTNLFIEIEIMGWPFAVGSLVWLLEASGATSVSILD